MLISENILFITLLRFVHDIGGKCYLLLEGFVREEAMEDLESSSQLVKKKHTEKIFDLHDCVSKS